MRAKAYATSAPLASLDILQRITALAAAVITVALTVVSASMAEHPRQGIYVGERGNSRGRVKGVVDYGTPRIVYRAATAYFIIWAPYTPALRDSSTVPMGYGTSQLGSAEGTLFIAASAEGGRERDVAVSALATGLILGSYGWIEKRYVNREKGLRASATLG